MRLPLAILFLVPFGAWSATYYVATNGNNTADGSLAHPWSNVWYAATAASGVTAGDTVIVKAGEYREFVTNGVSGTAGSPVTYTGERGPAGQWLTILDPSIDLTTGWVAATEIGTGVWKYTNLTWESQELSINHKDLGCVWTLGAIAGSSVFEGGAITTGVQIITLPSDYVYTNPMTHLSYQFWDGVEALYCSTNASTTYLRLRDGSDPNGLNIRASPNWDDHLANGAIARPGWGIDGKSYMVISNFLMRGSYGCFNVNGTAHHLWISSNYLANGYTRIMIGANSYAVTLSGNEMTMDYYGSATSGTWDDSNHNVTLYSLGKQLMDPYGSAADQGFFLNNCGNSNVFCFNYIHGGVGNGGVVQNSVSMATNTIICSNKISDFPSCGLFLDYGEPDTRVHHNSFENSEANIRIGSMDRTGETFRELYIYRNTFYQPTNTGDHIVQFWAGAPVVVTSYPWMWIYHNSFANGRGGMYPNEDGPEQGGMPHCFALNNLFCNQYYFYAGNISWWTNAAYVGALDYNLVFPVTFPSATNAAWFGSHNVNTTNAEWTLYSGLPNFKLSPSSPAINAALDVTVPFTINGTNYPALPNQSEQRIGPAWDIGAFEAGFTANATTLHVGTLRGP